jgi:hypothetical protein
MLSKLKASLASLLAAGAAAHGANIKPPVDLNTPVENPALVRAMSRVASDGSNAAKDALLLEIQRANYLAAMFTNEMKSTVQGPGMMRIEKGSRIGLLSAEKDGKQFLVLFSDWEALRAYTTLSVSGMILPARDAWAFALQGDTYQGIVINPAHNALPLERPMLEYLRANVEK